MTYKHVYLMINNSTCSKNHFNVFVLTISIQKQQQNVICEK